MNRTSGPANGRAVSRGLPAIVPLFILAAFFLPLPLFASFVLLAMSLALGFRAGPHFSPLPANRFIDPPPLRGPPF